MDNDPACGQLRVQDAAAALPDDDEPEDDEPADDEPEDDVDVAAGLADELLSLDFDSVDLASPDFDSALAPVGEGFPSALLSLR